MSPTNSSTPRHPLAPRERAPESISVVIPYFNEREVIDELISRLKQVLSSLHIPFEAILVDDGSSDGTWERLVHLKQSNSSLKLIRLSRNYGHQMAITCGLDSAKGEVVVIMDADLQDPPEVLPDIFQAPIKLFMAKWLLAAIFSLFIMLHTICCFASLRSADIVSRISNATYYIKSYSR